MSVVVQTDVVTSRRRTFALWVIMLGVLAALSVMARPAWSFEVTTTEPHGQSGIAAPVMRAPMPSSEDSCLYILKMARERSEDNAAARRYQQSAGSAAAIGLVFGVRFALGPSEVHKTRKRAQPVAAFHVWEARESGADSGHALAIADYRACRNEHALRTLTD